MRALNYHRDHAMAHTLVAFVVGVSVIAVGVSGVVLESSYGFLRLCSSTPFQFCWDFGRRSVKKKKPKGNIARNQTSLESKDHEQTSSIYFYFHFLCLNTERRYKRAPSSILLVELQTVDVGQPK